MIETAEHLYQAIEQMGRMQRILESYRNEILTKHPRNFALLAEGPLEQLRNCKSRLTNISNAWKPPGLPPVAAPRSAPRRFPPLTPFDTSIVADLPGGGRRYWLDVLGRVGWRTTSFWRRS